MTVLGAIIAGGSSSRMGGVEKAFLPLHGVSLIERVKSRLALQADHIVINANGDGARFAALACEIVPDLLSDARTPLAGLHAVLMLARTRGFEAVFTTPCDAPFLPLDVVKVLREAGKGKAIIAASEAHSHYLTGYWPATCAEALDDAIRNDGLRRVQDFTKLVNASELVWPDSLVDPFLNVNTPEELRFAELMMHV
jgi:molybdopterin-guanine dinucleotide biosynthesis protein A